MISEVAENMIPIGDMKVCSSAQEPRGVRYHAWALGLVRLQSSWPADGFVGRVSGLLVGSYRQRPFLDAVPDNHLAYGILFRMLYKAPLYAWASDPDNPASFEVNPLVL